jgi:hypothetical protein
MQKRTKNMSFDIIDPERDSKVLGLYQSRASPICEGQAAFRVGAWAQLPLLYERRPNAFYAPGLIARGRMPRMSTIRFGGALLSGKGGPGNLGMHS